MPGKINNLESKMARGTCTIKQSTRQIKSVPTPPTCYLHWIGCVTTYGLILTKSARFAFKPTHPPVGFSPMGARSVYLQSMMRSKTNKDENIQNYLKETLLLVFVLFLLVSLKQHLSGECFAAQTAASQDNRKGWNTKLSGNHSCNRMSLHTELSGCTQLEHTNSWLLSL